MVLRLVQCSLTCDCAPIVNDSWQRSHCHLHHRICAGKNYETEAICGTNSRYIGLPNVWKQCNRMSTVYEQVKGNIPGVLFSLGYDDLLHDNDE